MLDTSSFTVDAVGDDEPVTVPVFCNRVTINQLAGDTDFTFRAPLRSNTAVRYAAGQAAKLVGPFYAGQVIGFMATISGSATFQLLCDED